SQERKGHQNSGGQSPYSGTAAPFSAGRNTPTELVWSMTSCFLGTDDCSHRPIFYDKARVQFLDGPRRRLALNKSIAQTRTGGDRSCARSSSPWPTHISRGMISPVR